MKKPFDLTGEIFGALTVIGRDGAAATSTWRCLCVCGSEAVIATGNLRLKIGSVRCGCKARNAARKRQTRHGLAKSPEYRVWSDLRSRCTNPATASFVNYGGRGIAIAPEWMNFENFLADMGHKPSSIHSIERIDNDGNYEPGNCRWATAKEQGNNKRNNRMLTLRGLTLTMAQWADHLGWSGDMIERRVNLLRWSDEKVLTTPPRGWGPGHPRKAC